MNSLGTRRSWEGRMVCVVLACLGLACIGYVLYRAAPTLDQSGPAAVVLAFNER